MFRDYVLIIDPDATSRRRLVIELGEAHPVLVASDAAGALGRLRRWGPPRAVVSSIDLDAMSGGDALLEALAGFGPSTLLVRLVGRGEATAFRREPSAAIPALRVAWLDDAGDVAFAIERDDVAPSAFVPPAVGRAPGALLR